MVSLTTDIVEYICSFLSMREIYDVSLSSLERSIFDKSVILYLSFPFLKKQLRKKRIRWAKTQIDKYRCLKRGNCIDSNCSKNRLTVLDLTHEARIGHYTVSPYCSICSSKYVGVLFGPFALNLPS